LLVVDLETGQDVMPTEFCRHGADKYQRLPWRDTVNRYSSRWLGLAVG
jgi:hypothetical protein